MKIYNIVFVLLFLSVNSLEEGQKNIKRLTYKETFDPENSYYVQTMKMIFALKLHILVYIQLSLENVKTDQNMMRAY